MGKQKSAESRGLDGGVSERRCRGRALRGLFAVGIFVCMFVIVGHVCLLPDQKSSETEKRVNTDDGIIPHLEGVG